MSLTMWWPSPEAFEDLTVTDIEDGWQLSAPDDSELGAWLYYWSRDEEHHAFFEEAFLEVLTNHANLVLDDFEQNGETQVQPDKQSNDREQAEEVGTGSLS